MVPVPLDVARETATLGGPGDVDGIEEFPSVSFFVADSKFPECRDDDCDDDYDDCCTYGTLSDLQNADAMFPEFEYIGSY